MAEDLRRFLAGEPILARPLGRVERIVKWVKRRPLVAGLLAAVLVVALTGAAAFAWAFGETVEARNDANVAIFPAAFVLRQSAAGQARPARRAYRPREADGLRLRRRRENVAGRADARRAGKVIYPDGVQRDEGTIHIVYDYNRTSDGAVLMATFTEDDARAGCEVTDNVQLQVEVARLFQEQEFMNHAEIRATTSATLMRATMVGVLIAAALLSWPVQAAPRDEASQGSSKAAKLVLVEDGVSRAPIIVYEGAPPMTRRAAEELAEYIDKISGARPKVIEGEPRPLPERAIWVGFQPQVAKLFPEVDFEFEHPEEILIAAHESHLVIAGRDRWNPDHLVVEGIDEKIVGKQQEYGTAGAVYTFLQEQLGVCWLWPGTLGEDVPRRATISIAPVPTEYRYHPQIRARGGLFNFSALSNRGYGRAHEWTRRQRLQLGSLELQGGHAFTDWWERFHETHREYFALQPDGERSGFPNPRTVKLCQSNPAVWQQWLADVEKKLEKDPTLQVFSGSPNDGWASGHCTCENCRAWDHFDGEPRQFHWKSGNEIHPALSDRHVTFANRLAGLLKKRYPNKDYYVLMLAYGHSRPAPIKAVPAENVIMVSVANFFGRSDDDDRGSTRGATHREQFAAWGKVAPHLMWRPNTGSPAGWQQGLPDVSMTQLAKDFRFVADNNCIGLFVDSVWEHWATQGPQYYLMAQLAWNPRIDEQAVLDDYYDRAYGSAAEHVKAYFTVFETARQAHVAKHGGRAGLSKFTELYTADMLKRAKSELDRAASAVADGPELFRRRVEFVTAGFDYTHRMVENIHFMEHYWSKPDEQVAKKVLANWEAIQKILGAHPYALNPGPIRPTTPRMAGLHPEYPARKWKPQPKSQRPQDLDLD